MKKAIVALLVFVSGMAHADDVLDWKALPDLPAELGVAGPFTGVHNDTLLVAGGANFPEPVWDTDKIWRDTIYALPLTGKIEWSVVGKLPRPIGYGACVSTPRGVVCIGGNDVKTVFSDVFLLKSDGSVESLPSLPEPNCYGAATLLGNHIYLAGGTSGLGIETAGKTFLRLDLNNLDAGWKKLEAWPGPARAFNVLVMQRNGDSDSVYMMGGRYQNAKGELEFLSDVYEYNPSLDTERWRKRANIPVPQAAGAAATVGQSHIFLLAGADGSLYKKADDLKLDHPGFPKTIYAFHTITNTWIKSGEMPVNQVTTHAVKCGDRILLASGEVKPRVRTTGMWEIQVHDSEKTFAPLNWVAIVLYLAVVMGIGFFFARRNKSTDDFFRGGQRIPGWVAGLSIFATMLSSITFVATPARAYATDWTFILINVGILICAPLIAYFVLPFYRKINATSAYEYLEKRFSLSIRLFGSASFVLYQIGRMAVVMYLPALALAAITPLSLPACIIIMGVMSVIYCSFGGLEAVVWTDALQAIILLGGALISFVLIIAALDGGWGEFTTVAMADSKLRWADLDWSSSSYMAATFWVVMLGGIGNAIIPYSSDQAVVQRYVSTPTEGKARSAIWLNAGMSVIGTFLFFGLGTALYVFYKANPASIDPSFKTDSIFPLFISRELPIGIAGIVIAAIFAAAQSTISTSMNSTSTVLVTDFFRRLGWEASEKKYLNLARVLTVVLGVLGTAFALILAIGNIESAWKTFIMVVGFVMGPLCGIFLLGMFTKIGNTRGAVAGAIGGIIVLIFAKFGTEMSGLLYAPVGITASFVTGLLASFGGEKAKTV